jgi:hypothetical protein
MGSFWSLKKVFCTVIMIQGLVSRSRDLNSIGNLPLKPMNVMREEITTVALSFFGQSDLKARWRQLVLPRIGLHMCPYNGDYWESY